MKKILLVSLALILLVGCSITKKETEPTLQHLSTSVEENINATTQQNSNTLIQNEDNEILKLQVTSYESRVTSTNNNTTDQKIKDDTSSSPVIPFPEPEYKNPVILKVNGEEYTVEYREKMTVYDLMQILASSSQKPFIFSTKEYTGMGKFVDEINGIKNDNQKGLYWIYYMNGEPAKIGISNYIIHQGDTIEWKYENSKL
jgi:hypothetical protein